jgi:spermidine synthase
MKNTIIKIASYIWDIPIIKTSSPQNEYLELVWSNGKKTLNTKDANFSFGNASTVLEKAISPFANEIKDAKHILVLGFGCGSLLHLLEKKYHYTGKLTGIEYDAKIIELFYDHFASSYSLTPNVICCDAANFLKEDSTKFDIIVVDLFQELNNSKLLNDLSFLKALKTHTEISGMVILNTINRTEHENRLLSTLIIELGMLYKNVTTQVFQDINTLIVAR